MQRSYNCHTLLWEAVKALLYTLAAVMRMRGPALNHDQTTNLCLLHWHHASHACIHAHVHAHKILHTRTRLHPHCVNCYPNLPPFSALARVECIRNTLEDHGCFMNLKFYFADGHRAAFHRVKLTK